MPATRASTLWPLPGGSGRYLESLTSILRMAEAAKTTADAAASVVASFDGVTSTKAARSYLRVAATLGLLDIDGEWCELTPEGVSFLRTRDSRQIHRLLFERVAGVHELVQLLDARPRGISDLHERMVEAGFDWEKTAQIRYRLRWLEEVGVVERSGDRRGARYRRAPGYRSPDSANRPTSHQKH